MSRVKATKAFGIYKIRNVIDGKVYVGSTSRSFEKRWHGWRADLRRNKGNHHLLAAWNRYGADSFRFEILEIVTDTSALLARESFWMSKLNARDPSYGYNFAEPETRAISDHGKQALSQKSKSLWRDPMHRKKVIDAQRKRYADDPSQRTKNAEHMKSLWADVEFRRAAEEIRSSPEFRAKLSAAQQGKHTNSDEHRAATSARFKGCKLSPEHIEKVRLFHLGRTRSEETRKKISEVQRGRKQSPETVAKRAAALRGKPKSEQHRAKIKEALMRRGPISEETREKLRISHLGNTSRLGTGKKGT